MIKNIVFTTDSGVLKQMNEVVIIPSCIQDKNNSCYLDQVSITNEEIFNRRREGESFKTSSPLMGSYIETFEEQLKSYDEIIHFSMSGDVSAGSLNAAITAQNIVDPKRIHVIDTRQGGPGGGLVVELAKRLLKSGCSKKEIIEIVKEKIIPNVKTTFLVPNPIGFLQSGRNRTNAKITSHWKELVVKMMIKHGTQFEVALKEGKLLQDKMHHYNPEFMYTNFIEQHLDKDEVNHDLVVFGGTLLAKEKAENIKNFLKAKYPQYEVQQHDMGGVISAYACQDTVGVSYIKKK